MSDSKSFPTLLLFPFGSIPSLDPSSESNTLQNNIYYSLNVSPGNVYHNLQDSKELPLYDPKYISKFHNTPYLISRSYYHFSLLYTKLLLLFGPQFSSIFPPSFSLAKKSANTTQFQHETSQELFHEIIIFVNTIFDKNSTLELSASPPVLEFFGPWLSDLATLDRIPSLPTNNKSPSRNKILQRLSPIASKRKISDPISKAIPTSNSPQPNILSSIDTSNPKNPSLKASDSLPPNSPTNKTINKNPLSPSFFSNKNSKQNPPSPSSLESKNAFNKLIHTASKLIRSTSSSRKRNKSKITNNVPSPLNLESPGNHTPSKLDPDEDFVLFTHDDLLDYRYSNYNINLNLDFNRQSYVNWGPNLQNIVEQKINVYPQISPTEYSTPSYFASSNSKHDAIGLFLSKTTPSFDIPPPSPENNSKSTSLENTPSSSTNTNLPKTSTKIDSNHSNEYPLLNPSDNVSTTDDNVDHNTNKSIPKTTQTPSSPKNQELTANLSEPQYPSIDDNHILKSDSTDSKLDKNSLKKQNILIVDVYENDLLLTNFITVVDFDLNNIKSEMEYNINKSSSSPSITISSINSLSLVFDNKNFLQNSNTAPAYAKNTFTTKNIKKISQLLSLTVENPILKISVTTSSKSNPVSSKNLSSSASSITKSLESQNTSKSQTITKSELTRVYSERVFQIYGQDISKTSISSESPKNNGKYDVQDSPTYVGKPHSKSKSKSKFRQLPQNIDTYTSLFRSSSKSQSSAKKKSSFLKSHSPLSKNNTQSIYKSSSEMNLNGKPEKRSRGRSTTNPVETML
ncbi:hypothetical protein BB560_003772, partial [Smittium megazygosporum]